MLPEQRVMHLLHLACQSRVQGWNLGKLPSRVTLEGYLLQSEGKTCNTGTHQCLVLQQPRHAYMYKCCTCDCIHDLRPASCFGLLTLG